MTTNNATITPAAARAELKRRVTNKARVRKGLAKLAPKNQAAFEMDKDELLAIAAGTSTTQAPKAQARTKAPAKPAARKAAPKAAPKGRKPADPQNQAAWALAKESGYPEGSTEFWTAYRAIKAAQRELAAVAAK